MVWRPSLCRSPRRGPAVAAMRRASIDPDSANADLRPGDPVHMRALLACDKVFANCPWGPDTVHLYAADGDGLMVSATPSGRRPSRIATTISGAR